MRFIFIRLVVLSLMILLIGCDTDSTDRRASSGHNDADAVDTRKDDNTIDSTTKVQDLGDLVVDQTVDAPPIVPYISEEPDPTNVVAQTATGEKLYADNCASCHQSLTETTKTNRTAIQIRNAIQSTSTMTHLASLNDDALQAIEAVLKVEEEPVGTDPEIPAELDGTALYMGNCASCHGPLLETTKKAKTATQIRLAIQSVPEMMGLASLTVEDLLKIEGVLPEADPEPPIETTLTGAPLYNQYCSACHGDLGISSKLGTTSTAISDAISSVSLMNHLATLTSSDIDAIAEVLASPQINSAGLKRPRIGTRYHIASRLRRIFSTETTEAEAKRIDKILDVEILKNASSFGGLCSRQDPECGRRGHLYATNDPLPNAIRRGYLIRACANILSDNRFVKASLAQAKLTASSPANAANTQKIFTWFFPSYESDASVIAALVDLGQATKDGGNLGIDQWRMILAALCESNLMETL